MISDSPLAQVIRCGTCFTVITLKDIAQRAGVSKATVSRALGGHPSIAAETRERVMRIARELGYQRDPRLASLSARRWPGGRGAAEATIAYLTDRYTGRRPHKVEAAQDRARELGYHCYHYQADEIANVAAFQNDLLNRGCRGLILDLHDAGAVPAFDWSEFSVVLIGEERQDLRFHRVGTNWRQVMHLAVEAAHAAGCQRLGFVLQDMVGKGLKHDLLAEMMAASWLEGDHHAERVLAFVDGVGVQEAFEAWLTACRPDVVLTPNCDVLDWIGSRDINFIQLVGGIDLKHRPVARVDVRLSQRVRLAVDLLHDLLRLDARGIPLDGRTVLSPATWVPGDTLVNRS